MADEQDEKPTFKVTDKRKVKRDSEPKAADEAAKAAGEEAGTVLGDEAGVHIGSSSDPDEPPIDFGNFVMSLAHSALIALGVVEDPVTREKSFDLPSARQTIQIIEMLKEKTEGNLDEDEAKLIGSLLYELRISFVNASAKKVNSDS